MHVDRPTFFGHLSGPDEICLVGNDDGWLQLSDGALPEFVQLIDDELKRVTSRQRVDENVNIDVVCSLPTILDRK